MKNLKLNLSAIALLLGVGSALATSHHSFANRKWGRDRVTGIYTEVTGMTPPDYKCASSTNICTEEYPADVDPNNQAGDQHPGTALPSNTVLGNFSL